MELHLEPEPESNLQIEPELQREPDTKPEPVVQDSNPNVQILVVYHAS